MMGLISTVCSIGGRFGIAFAALETEQYDLQIDADLRGRQADAAGGDHGFLHVADQCIQLGGGEALDQLGDAQQPRIAEPQNLA
jgi:hypothetical protein